jgi:predicted TPR repeat methyltransferase
VAPGGSEPESDERQAFIARMQEVARAVAFDRRSWSPDLAFEVRTIFDDRAAGWWTHRSPQYIRPLTDAIEAAGARGGVCLDIGSGVSLQEETLCARFDRVIAIDISAAMLRLAERHCAELVRADASALPILDKSVDFIVCVNMFLFPGECTRVLRETGTIAFISTSGSGTPIYLSPEDVRDALIAYGDSRFATVSGTSGDAFWTIARRAVR